MSNQFPAIIVVLPLVVSFFIFFSGWWVKRAGFPLAIGALSCCVLLSIGILNSVLSHGTIEYWLGGWDPPWGIEYRVDHFNAIMLVLVSGLSLVAAVYAKALIGVLEATGQTDAVVDELESLVVDCLDRLPKFEAALASLRISHEEKVALLDKAFQRRMTPVLLNFLKVVSRHGRLDCLRAIRRAAKKRVAEMQGRVDAELVTATDIDASLQQQVRSTLEAALGQPVDLTAKVRPELIGGMLVRIGDSAYDASVVNQLGRLRDEALASTNLAIQASLERFAARDA